MLTNVTGKANVFQSKLFANGEYKNSRRFETLNFAKQNRVNLMNINNLHAETAYYFYTLLGFRFCGLAKQKKNNDKG